MKLVVSDSRRRRCCRRRLVFTTAVLSGVVFLVSFVVYKTRLGVVVCLCVSVCLCVCEFVCSFSFSLTRVRECNREERQRESSLLFVEIYLNLSFYLFGRLLSQVRKQVSISACLALPLRAGLFSFSSSAFSLQSAHFAFRTQTDYRTHSYTLSASEQASERTANLFRTLAQSLPWYSHAKGSSVRNTVPFAYTHIHIV